jgi:hypothetical protein
MTQEEQTECKCEICGIDYKKPAKFIEYNNQHPSIFFKWSLKYCDKCRIEKQKDALKSLPTVLSALYNTQTPTP